MLTKILPARFLIFLVMKLSKDARPPEKSAPEISAPVQAQVVPSITESASHTVDKTAEQSNVTPSFVPMTSTQAARILSLYPGKFHFDDTANN